MMMKVKINNVPESATHRQWIVARLVDCELWFYDAWAYHRAEDAQAQAREIGGLVVENTDWLKDCFKS